MQKIIFPHIWKSGGSSFKYILRQIVPESETLNINSPGVTYTTIQQYNCLEDHMPVGAHLSLVGPSTYMGLIRNPVERVLSSYYYMGTNHKFKHPFYNVVKDHSLAECYELVDTIPYFKDNFINHQVRVLSGVATLTGGVDDFMSPIPHRDIKESDLEQAISNIENLFSFIGTTENMNADLPRLSKVLNRDISCTMPHIGKTPHRPKEQPSPELVELIKSHNILDQALYDYVLKRK